MKAVLHSVSRPTSRESVILNDVPQMSTARRAVLQILCNCDPTTIFDTTMFVVRFRGATPAGAGQSLGISERRAPLAPHLRTIRDLDA